MFLQWVFNVKWFNSFVIWRICGLHSTCCTLHLINNFSLGSDACQIILHHRRFVSLFASNFCAFRSICSSTNSLPSSEYIFQRDWAIIFIQIAYLMKRLHIKKSTSGRCHQFLNTTNISWICYFVSFGVQEKKVGKIAVSLFSNVR